jgi:hypothetical protein
MLNYQTTLRWGKETRLTEWLDGSRLNLFGALQSAVRGDAKPDSKEQLELATRIQMLVKKLEHLVSETPHEAAEKVTTQNAKAPTSSRKRDKLARLA